MSDFNHNTKEGSKLEFKGLEIKSEYLQKDLNMNNAEYGFFVSIAHTGKMVGIIFFMFVLNLRHRKYTLVIAVFFQGSSYVL